MPINIDSDRLIPLSQVPKYLEKRTGKRPNTATIFRWRQRGISGIRLESVLIGGRSYTSVEALERFCSLAELARHGRISNGTEAGIARATSIRQRQLEKEADRLGI